MVEVGVVARRAVTRLQEVDQGYVSGMEEVNVAKLPTALKVLKATQVSAFHMVVVAGKALSLCLCLCLFLFLLIFLAEFFQCNLHQQGSCTLCTWFVVLIGLLLMLICVGVNLWAVQREHRGAPCSAKLMEVASDASSRIATRVLKAVHLFVKDMVVASVACMMEVEYAQRVCMEALSFVLHMVVGNGVQLRDVVKVQGGAQIIV
jgi:lipid-A-disaccharide synthase-like uncharacterized protein